MLLADVPLETRVQAAVAVIWDEAALGVVERFALVAAAIWPAGAPVTNDADRVSVSEPVSAHEERDQARARFRAGATISEVADMFGVPWVTAREWVRGRG